jgi:acyl-CoA thioesterase I
MRRALLLFCLVLLLGGCGARQKETPVSPIPAPATQPADDRPVILAFGDSLTAGLGVPREENYPSRLQGELDQLGYRYQVINAGVSGDTSHEGLTRLEGWLRRTRPEIVILELGANDGLRGLPVPAMQANLAAMIEKIREAGATVVLAGMQIPPNYGPEYTDAFRKVFHDLAEQYGVLFIPFLLEGVGGSQELNQADGIHPTGAGYKVVVGNVMAVLAQALKR